MNKFVGFVRFNSTMIRLRANVNCEGEWGWEWDCLSELCSMNCKEVRDGC